MTNAEKIQRHRAGSKAAKLRHIAVLDMETEPFDAATKAEILPFVAELYSDQFGSIVIWDDEFEAFVDKLYQAIIALPDSYTIYAHNGGKFDYMFLVSKLRGEVKFKGRAIMAAKIGAHELRDSLHLLPEKLAAWKKDHFDYAKLRKASRHKFEAEILAYLHSDCVYLFDIIKSFVKEFGLKISIGQAAFSELKKHYKVGKVREQTDAFLRRYFFGGRVECIAGAGEFDSGHRPCYKLYDVNSMYPDVMANCDHPIGNEYNWRRGNPDENTVFIDVECINHGALIARQDGLSADPGNGRGRFYTTKREFDIALKYDLIEDIKIIGVVDNCERSNFAKFIVPMYERRQVVKAKKEILKAQGATASGGAGEDSPEYEELHKEDLFLKYLLNNSYGKFAQNPRNFKEYYYTDVGAMPPIEWMEFLNEMSDELRHKYSMPVDRADNFAVWCKPSPIRGYNNVGTGASITGAARAKLLEAMQHADDPIYCDTDSLIARGLRNIDLHQTRLGAWKIEQEFDRVIIAGKKTYACEVRGYPVGHERRIKVRCKGASGLVENGVWRSLNWADFGKMLDNQIIETLNKAPTISRTGEQDYMRRRIRTTAPRVSANRRNLNHVATRIISAS